ncbi:hypothetical protein ACRS6B_07260 [Nocardia asteroides]
MGRAFENPGNADSASPRPPDITNPLSDRHVAAPETGLNAGLDKPPASPALPSRYATEPNPETPGAPQAPAGPQLNPHSLEYHQDPSRLPTVGAVPHLQPAPQPSGKPERKRLIAQMGGDSGKDPKRRKKQNPPESPPAPPPPQPTPEPPAPTSKQTPKPKPRKRDQPPAPLVREELVVREEGEAIGEAGAEGERVRPAARTRQWVRSLQQKLPWLTDDQIDTAELLISEVVANSLRWTQGKVAVIATATDSDDTRKTRFTVTDESEIVPERTGMPTWDAERGRGGEFVAMLSDEHGTTVRDNGKATWFELHGPRGDEPGTGEANSVPGGGRPGAPAATPAGSEAPTGQPAGDLTPDTADAIQDGHHPADSSPEPGQATEPAGNAMRQAAEAVLADYHARSGPDIPEADRLTNVPATTLADMLRGDDPADATAAMIEVIRRGDGKILRWTQVAAMTAMRGGPVNMDAGEGKSLVFLAHAIRDAMITALYRSSPPATTSPIARSSDTSPFWRSTASTSFA